MIGQRFSFPHCISTLFIWCYRVCYFALWARVLWGHHATLVFIERIGPSNDCASGSPNASSGTVSTCLTWFFALTQCCALTWVTKILLRAISNVHESHIWPAGRRFPTLCVMRVWLAGTLIISTGEPNENVTVKFLTKHLSYVKFYISFLICAQP